MSTRTSGSFSVSSLDSEGFLINQANSLLALTMITGAEIGGMTVTSSSKIINEPAEMKIAFLSPVPIRNGDLIYITLPPEVTPPSRNNLTCLGDGNVITTNQKCTLNSQVITVTTSTSRSLIPSKSLIQFRIRYPLNPPSTASTSDF
jgi:hypothetical protein